MIRSLLRRLHPRTWRQVEPEPVDLHAVCRDDQVVDAVHAGDLTRARQLADDVLVDLLAALAATGRAS